MLCTVQEERMYDQAHLVCIIDVQLEIPLQQVRTRQRKTIKIELIISSKSVPYEKLHCESLKEYKVMIVKFH